MPPRKPPTGHGRGALTLRANPLHRARTIVGTHQGVLLVQPPSQARRVIRGWQASTPLGVTWTSIPCQRASCGQESKPFVGSSPFRIHASPGLGDSSTKSQCVQVVDERTVGMGATQASAGVLALNPDTRVTGAR